MAVLRIGQLRAQLQSPSLTAAPLHTDTQPVSSRIQVPPQDNNSVGCNLGITVLIAQKSGHFKESLYNETEHPQKLHPLQGDVLKSCYLYLTRQIYSSGQDRVYF